VGNVAVMVGWAMATVSRVLLVPAAGVSMLLSVKGEKVLENGPRSCHLNTLLTC
jgi:hypothetical protein